MKCLGRTWGSGQWTGIGNVILLAVAEKVDVQLVKKLVLIATKISNIEIS